jgi:lipid-A-disaccharide synthase
MIIAGEASGDHHGQHVVLSMRALDPHLEFRGIGGSGLRQAGVDLFFPASELAVVGLTEVLSKTKAIFRGLRRAKAVLEHWRPHLLILIDFPDFNFLVAAAAKRLNIPILYYVSPQIWAWRTGRVRKIKKLVDHMAVILPFEEAFYRRFGVPVTYVGHPLLDQLDIASLKSSQEAWRGPGGPVVALLPGSRNGEIMRHLPVMLKSAISLNSRNKGIRFILPLSPTADPPTVHGLVAKHGKGLDIHISTEGMGPVLSRSWIAVVASGTATLETAIYGVPMVIIYKLSPVSYAMGRLLIRVNQIGLVNLIAEERLAPELIQHEATPSAISRLVQQMIDDKALLSNRRKRLLGVRHRLGQNGASQRVADIAFALASRNN